MALKIDTVAHACRMISREVRDAYKNLSIHYIVHHEGQRTEALSLAAQELVQHPAAETAMHILQQPRPTEDSVLLGTAVARQNTFFGLATRDRLLALCTMNLDQFDSLKEARRFAYHLAWHAIDALHYHGNPDNRTGDATEVLIRKRSAIEIAYANLQADTFAAVISALHTDRDAIGRMALIRSNNALSPRSLQNPEYYPFAIASEASKFAFEHVNAKQLAKKKLVPTALKLAGEVAKTFDEFSVEHWLAFSEPAQDMAWRGFSKGEILSAAINTSQNTYVRATAYLVSEIVKMEPSPITQIRDSYSPYADDDFNQSLHQRIVNETFEDVIAQGLKQKSVLPFLRLANKQNDQLTEGRVTGWCGGALQAAAVAFENAIAAGAEPEALVRREFQGELVKINWKDLKRLGDDVVDQKRAGNIVTMSKLVELSQNVAELKSVHQSILQTMQDPVYQQKLDAVRELTPSSPKLSAPVPNAPSAGPRAPSAAAASAPRGPSLGRTAKAPVVNKDAAEQKKKKEGGDSATQ